jgi:hypothetical protein
MKRREFVGATVGVDYARALASRFGLSYDELPPEEQAFWVDAVRLLDVRVQSDSEVG